MQKRFHEIYLLVLFILPGIALFAQVEETKSWCNLSCEYTSADQHNAALIRLQMQNDSIKQSVLPAEIMRFPIRFGLVQKDSEEETIQEIELQRLVQNLNKAFEPVGFVFYLSQIDRISLDLSIEELSANSFNLYDNFSGENDVADMITIYILDHDKAFCTVENNSISCGRTGGFSYILSERANNVVLSRFDLSDLKIVAHEFGHFFGLFHTFEEHIFGKDAFDAGNCHQTGDRICDTPPDPGSLYEIYVNYSICEMIGFKDENGNEYKPLLDNYMSYYKPCYLKEYSFTPDQISAMQLASQLKIREQLAR